MNYLFVLWVFCTALFCWGFHNAFKEDEVLGSLGKLIRDNLPAWIQSPTTECPVCMASVHGTVWFLIASFHFHSFQPDLFMWVLFVFSISGLNFIIKEYLYP